MSRGIDQIKPWARHLTVDELKERLVQLAKGLDEFGWGVSPAIIREACWRLERPVEVETVVREVIKETEEWPDDPLEEYA
jgi:hypothetical protein